MSDIGRDDQIETGNSVDASDRGESGGRGTIITLTTVVALLLATALTVLGVGASDTAVANFDASSWLWSSSRGEVDRVNGVTARVDTRTKIQDAQNHEIQITQTDRYLILRDLATGQVSALDLTTLQVSAVMPTTPGLGVSVALHGEIAFVIDSVQGQIRQLDPRSLAPTGDAIVLPNGIIAGGFDGKGALWIAVPTEGTVVAIQPGTNGASPKVLRTITIATPGHDLVLSALDEGLAVLDNTDQTLMIVRDKVDTIAVPVDQPALMPARTVGTAVAITVAQDRRVVVVDGKKISVFTVAGTGPLSPAVVYAGRVYAADLAAGVVYELDSSGKVVNLIRIAGAGGVLELEVRENHLFINAPNGSTAHVVNDQHVVKEVNKYSDGVLGADPPPPPPPVQDPKPAKTVPGKPQNVSASAGDASATIAWRKAPDNGSAITKYVVEGAGQSITVGVRQRSVEIKGLVNAQTYRFTVHAVNAMGAGPKAQSPPVTPTADVPDPPTSVTASPQPDGTVDVTWPAANGQGRRILSYTVTSISGGGQAPVGSVTATTMKVAAGSLTYGTQYAFTVVAINDRNAGSQSSPVSNTVVPYTAPGPPRNLAAATVTDQRGAIGVSWQAANDNGRPVTKYVVDAGGGPRDVMGTSVTLTGFPDDTPVQVSVHAVNLAGNGPDATATARTIGVPTVTVTGDGAGYNSLSVTFTPNNNGGAAVCALQVGGGGTAQAACTTQPVTLTVGGLWPNGAYNYTVSVTSAAGAASAAGARATNQLRFTVICPNNTNGYCNNGIYAYRGPSQQGTAINPALGVGTTGMPQCYTTGNRVVNATPWGGKSTDQWVRLQYGGGTAYFPWAWASLDGGDNLGLIPGPPC